MDFVLALHSHLPYVLNHGRWPHGSDWIAEGTLDTYLPLLEVFRALSADGVPAPVTIGVTPVLANQLASPVFQAEMEDYFVQRLAACAEAPASLDSTGDGQLKPVADFWKERITRLRTLWRTIDGDVVGALRQLEDAGRIEIMGSAATHGFLPLLGRDESIQLQLAVGFREHERLFGRAPRGCWLPECAYRPRGPWDPWPGSPRAAVRRGTDEFVADAGFGWVFVDAHLVMGGTPIGISTGGEIHSSARQEPLLGRSPYRGYGVLSGGSTRLSTLVRDPRVTRQVWSRQEGYPGDGDYLEFHKLRWPGGLRLWRVTGSGIDLGGKQPYDPARAAAQAAIHARHFAGLLAEVAAELPAKEHPVLAAPFDTELFGHWWFEGPDFLSAMYRSLAGAGTISATTASAHLDRHPPRTAVRLPEGTWGANGDYSMWLGPRTAWTWQRLWPLEETFWSIAARTIDMPARHAVLAQAARTLLLAQSSDWQFIMSTGVVADYGERRFKEHCSDLERLLQGLGSDSTEEFGESAALAERLRHRDDLFPEVLAGVRRALGGSRAPGASSAPAAT